MDLQKILPAPGKYTIQAALLDRNGDEIRSTVVGWIHEERGDVSAARQFFTNVTSRNEYAVQQAAEALKRLPAQ